jgi:uncharacterized coiled-coil protein SlyX
MNDPLLQRLEKIESHLAHLENLCDKLNEVVIDQGKVLKKLQTHQQRLAQTVETMEVERIKSDRSKPPHYQ